MTKTTADGETLSLQAMLDMQIDARLSRAANAAEDAAGALTRIADALETLTALFGSTLGTGRVVCGSDRPAHFGPAVKFIRTGDGRRSFPCDRENADSTDED